MSMLTKVVVAANLHVFDILFDTDITESSSSEDETIIIVAHTRKRRRNKIKPTRILGYCENVIPNMTTKQFKSHFRMSPAMFDDTLQLLVPLMGQQDKGRPIGDIRKKLLAILWLLATPDSFRSVGDRFNMSKGNICDDFIRVIQALNQAADQVIKWPTHNEKEDIKRSFMRFGGMRDVIGAIDGTHVPIRAPKHDPEVYITRKSEYAMTLQCIAIPSLKFTDTFVGYPGSVSDTRIFRNLYIYETIQNNLNGYCPNIFILGDKAYPLLPWLIPPYIERRPLTPIQRNFNNKHASTRQVVERSFGLLFGRFRRLKYLDMHRTDLIPVTINACCVLHNICINHLEDDRIDYIQDGRDFVLNNVNQAVIANDDDRQNNNIRDVLANELYLNNI